LAHSKSALKRWRQSLEARERNRATKSRTRTLLTKALFAVEDDATAAENAVREAVSALDKAAQKGVIHKNAAARSKSRLLKRFNLGTANAILAAQNARKERLLAKEQLPRVQRAVSVMYASRTGSNELKKLQQYLPDMIDNGPNGLIRQIQVAIAAYKAGITVAVNLDIGGFDTHGDHDNSHIPRLMQLLEGLDFIGVEAERQGIAGNYVVLVGSDFGRTPGYNPDDGKDHWAVSSVIAMGKGIQGGRVLGGTDERHNVLNVNTSTVKPDEKGIRLEPKHIHQNLRRLAGIAEDDLMKLFPLQIADGEDLKLFA
jgi:ribosomal protein S20